MAKNNNKKNKTYTRFCSVVEKLVKITFLNKKNNHCSNGCSNSSKNLPGCMRNQIIDF